MSKLQYLSLVVVTASIVEVRGNIAHLCMLAYLSDPEVTCVFDLISRYLRHMAKQSAQLAAPSPCLGTGLLVCFHSKIDLFNSKICRLEVNIYSNALKCTICTIHHVFVFRTCWSTCSM